MKYIYLILFFSLACDTQLNGDRILQKSIEAHGAKYWNKIDSIDFNKTISLFDSLGNIEKKLIQKQKIMFDPFKMMLISNHEHGKNKIIWENNLFHLYENGMNIVDSLKLKLAENSIKAAFFAFWLPKNFLNKKANISYIGIRMVNMQEVYILKVIFQESTDIWHVFIDTKNFLNLGYSVWHDGHWSLIWNESFARYMGILLVEQRKSYKSDSLYQLKYMRANYLYEVNNF